MSVIVVDSSALMRTVQTRPDAPIYQKIVSASDCYAPRLIVSELANALWKTVRFQGLPSHDARKLLSIMLGVPYLLNDENYAKSAMNISISAEHPVYDCMFIAIGRDMNVPILTSDMKLRRKFPNDRFVDINN